MNSVAFGKLVLAEVTETYKACTDYSDEGRAEWALEGKNKSQSGAVSFRTWFVRPGQFVMVLSAVDNITDDIVQQWTYEIQMAGKSVVSSWSIQQVNESEASLGDAIAKASGITHGAAHLVPRLLLPGEVGGYVPWDVRGFQVTGCDQAMYQDSPCFVVSGVASAGYKAEIWVRKTDHALVRTERSMASGSDTLVERIWYEGKPNGDLSIAVMTAEVAAAKHELQVDVVSK